jgi:hypothetical protein
LVLLMGALSDSGIGLRSDTLVSQIAGFAHRSPFVIALWTEGHAASAFLSPMDLGGWRSRLDRREGLQNTVGVLGMGRHEPGIARL